MRELELLAPARNADIGIAAIDCGADAVYMAGPDFGARKAAGNPVEDIARLCSYAHRFGARVFVTFNISIREGEDEALHSQMRAAQQAGADAFIIRDPRAVLWDDISVPLHASTQCAIRSVEDALLYEKTGCGRIILERQLPLGRIREICAAVRCEVEAFVHGALCVCYSGQCRLSEYLDGRSADRGDCIQACRSRYDLADASGKILARGKALLSLKDLDLHERLAELAAAGVSSFKIEGRLKGEEYVRNLVRLYSKALDELISANPGKYRRSSCGKVKDEGFTPDPSKTFNREYTSLFLDGKRSRGWASMNAPKHLGEKVGTVLNIRKKSPESVVTLKLEKGVELHNGDGFTLVQDGEITGFRGDVCEGNRVRCRLKSALREGEVIYRNTDAAFMKRLETAGFRREIPVSLDVKISDGRFEISAESQDGRKLSQSFAASSEIARNRERQEEIIRAQLSKKALHYSFELRSLESGSGELPLLAASTLNAMRRSLAEGLEAEPPVRRGLFNPDRPESLPELPPDPPSWQLMISKYCVRFELGLCPVHQGAKDGGPLYLLNNGRRLALHFDCKNCEMSVRTPVPAKP